MNITRFFTPVMILTALFLFAGTQQADAQILKRLKKKAEDAASRKLEDKTVKETNKAMDTLLNNGKGDDNKTGGSNGDSGNGSGPGNNDGSATPAPEKEQISMYSKSDGCPVKTSSFSKISAMIPSGIFRSSGIPILPGKW